MKHLDNVKLLRLVADDELAAFANALNLGGISANRAEIKKNIAEIEPRLVVDAILASKGDTLAMLADIFRTVGRHNVSLRTTACALVLPGIDGPLQHVFSRQVMSMIATFSDEWSTAGRHNTFARVGTLIARSLVPLTERVRREGRVRRVHRPDRRYPGLMKHSNIVNDRLVREVDAYSPLLRSAYNRLADALAAGGRAPPDVDALLSGLTVLEGAQHEWRKAGVLDKSPYGNATSPERWEYARNRVRDPGLFALLDLLLGLADTITPDARQDFLQLAILKDRPRVFELWVMMRALDLYAHLGAQITLEGLDVQRDTWILNFARAAQPVARLTLRTKTMALYYQKFVPGAMPDILLEDSTSRSALWIVDPKYSEKGGYTFSSYVNTAKRYQAQFQPIRSIVAEFFPREDLGTGTPWTNPNGAAVVFDVRPSGAGWKWLAPMLLATQAPLNVLAIDVSSSHLEIARGLARGGSPRGDHELVVLFASDVKTTSGSLANVLGVVAPVNRTRLRPLVEYLEKVRSDGTVLGTVELWTDGQFDDDDVDVLRQRLRDTCTKLVP